MVKQTTTENDSIYKSYKFGKTILISGADLGEGTFSKVKLCEHMITGQKVVIS